MTEEEWWEKYEPIKNPFDENASFEGCMFETYGVEMDYVASRNCENIVWTIVDGDEGQWIVTGMHYVNRLGYLITAKSWETGDEEVALE